MPASIVKKSVPPPPPCGAVPSERQLAWQRLQFYGFIHFTTNAFTDKEWGFGDEKPSIFNPSALDARQWASVAKQAGMRGLILTCKHHDGFCLWPSKHTAHSVKNSPWRGGKGDVVRELCDACAEVGIKFGVYLSPWDRNHAEYGRPEYLTYYRAQLRELLTQYGELFEVWFDGANGGDGWYGGANERRSIDNSTYYDWPNTCAIVRELQPGASMFSDAGPDIRWVGNESGFASETTWYNFDMAGRYPGFPKHDDLGVGHENGTSWLPPEVDVSIRPGWFYHQHEDNKVRSVANLVDMYFESVGRGANLLLNLPPDRRGLVHETDVKNLLGMRHALDLIFKDDLARHAAASASSVWEGCDNYGARNAIDGSTESYWAAEKNDKTPSIEIAFPSTTTVNTIAVGEHIALGQRVKSWTLEARRNGAWQKVTHGTTIGIQRFVRFAAVTADALRLVVNEFKASPTIECFSAFNAPSLTRDPEISRDSRGMVTINAGEGVNVRYSVDDSAPNAHSPIFQHPFPLPDCGTVRASVLPDDNPGSLQLATSSTTEKRFGLAKTKWKIVKTDSEETEGGFDGRAANAIDDNPKSFWHTQWKAARPGYPHELVIDLGEERVVTAVGYLPRQDNCPVGIVQEYAIHAGLTIENLGAPTATGRFDNIVNSPTERIVTFDKPLKARYIRFVGLSSTDGSPCASAAEISVFV